MAETKYEARLKTLYNKEIAKELAQARQHQPGTKTRKNHGYLWCW